MASKNKEVTTSFKVDITDLKKGIQEANRQIRLANAEFKAASSGMDNWQKSTDGVSSKITQLDKVLNGQNKILDSYKQQLALIVAEQGENSKGADEMRIKIANQQAAVNKTAAELEKYKGILNDLEAEQIRAADSTDKQSNAYEDLKSTISEQESRLESLKKEYSNTILEQGKSSEAADRLAREIEDLSGELNKNKKSLSDAENAADELEKSLEDVGDSADDVSSGGLSTFTVALGNLAANVISSVISKMADLISTTIEVGASFDASMSQVSAVSGATGDDLEALREKAKEMGASTKFTASETADAFNYMAMAGWKTEDMLNGIDGILNLAAASGADLATTSDIVTDALTAMGYSAGDAGRLADVMAAASSNANTNVEMMGGTFKYVAPVVGALGYTMEDTAVAIGLMANSGIKAEQAGTALRSILTRLATDAGASSKSLGALGTLTEKLGVEFYNTDGTTRSLNDVLTDARAAWQGLSEEQQTSYGKIIAGQEAMSGWLAIMNAAPSDVDKLTEAVENSNGAAEKMATIMQDNLSGDLIKLGSQFEGVQIAIYEKFEPALRAGVDVLEKLLDAVNFVVEHSTEFTAALTAMATAIGAYLAYTTALKVMTEGWEALTIVTKAQAAAQTILNAVMSANPIGLIIAAISALVAAFLYLWNNSEEFRNFWIAIWEDIQTALAPVIEFIKGLFAIVSEVFTNIIEFFKNNWQNIIAFLINPFAGLFKYAYDNFDGFRDFVDNVIEKIKEIFGKIAGWVNEHVFQRIIKNFEFVITFFKEAWTVISGLATGSWKAIKAIWEVVSNWFNDNVITPVKNIFSALWEGIKTAAYMNWEAIKLIWNVVSSWFNDNIISPVKNFFSDMWDKLKTGASDAWEGIKSVFGVVAEWFEEKFKKAWEKVKDVFSTGGKIFDGIKEGITDAFKIVVNAIIRGINKVISVPFNAINEILNKIRKIEIAGISPFAEMWKENPFTVPKIPELAQGGVLKRGQVGLLEGNGAEAVIPLENNKKWITATARALKGALTNEGILGGVGDTINNYNFTQNNTSPKALSRLDIYRQTKNQLTMARGGLT